MQEDIIIETGERKSIKIGFLNYIWVVYCGMSSEEVFSVGWIEGHGHHGYALNLYFPKNKSTIRLGKERFRVLSVDKEKIRIQLVREGRR